MKFMIDEKKLIEVIKNVQEHMREVNKKPVPVDARDIFTLFIEMVERQPKVGEWIPADEPPKTDDYILLSFENFTIPMVGRYEKFEDGSGNYYLGDCDEKDTCLANNLFVNGWQPLPAPYRPDQEEPEQPKAAWKEAMMRTFLGRNT